MHLGRKTLSLLLSLALMLSLLPLAAAPAAAADAPTTEWSDNKADSFSVSDETAKTVTITSAAELALLAYNVNNNGGNNYSGWTITLGTDLDLSAHKWTPIGNDNYRFTGVFDGRGHTISGLYVSGSYNYAGLFGFVSGGTVQDLTVRGSVTVTDTDSNFISAGGVAGLITNYNGKSTVQNCRSEVTVKATVENNDSTNRLACAGGIVGRITGNYGQDNSTVLNCYHSGNLSATTTCTEYPFAYVGGVVANLYEYGTVQNCCHTGAVTATVNGESGNNYAGGVAGNISSSGTVQNCYSIGAISASGASNEYTFTGGVAGCTNSVSIVTGNYYRSDTATYGIGKLGGGNPSNDGAAPLTAEQFKDQSSFTNGNDPWDFTNTWIMDANRPRLRSNIGTADDPFLASSWSQLYDALQLGGFITLTANVKFGTGGGDHESTALVVPASAAAVLDLAGHTVDRGLYDPTKTAAENNNNAGVYSTFRVLGVEGGLTLNDSSGNNSGKITGGNLHDTNDGGGIYIRGGTVTMNGGSVTGNGGGGGAGVTVNGDNHNKRGSFTMNGGVITGNIAYDYLGGGVKVDYGSFTMTGGTITGNTAREGAGGVYVMPVGTFTVSGNATVTGNHKGTDASAADYNSNVQLATDTVVTVAGALTGTTPIGVTMAAPGTFTDGLSGHGDTTYFVSDDTKYHVELKNDGGEALLAINRYTVTWKNGDYVLGTDTVEYGLEPEYTGETPTKAADAQYTYAFAGWTPEVYAVTADATYTATFTASPRSYTVTWKNGDYVLAEDAVEYGITPAYTGETPTKADDAQYTYAFSGWTPEVYSVTADVTYTAVFAATAKPQNSNAPVYYDPAPAAKTVQTFEPVMTFDGGTVAVSPEKAKEGDAVRLAATPEEGQRLWSLTAERADGKVLMMASDALGSAQFTMPGCKVTVNAVFLPTGAAPTVVLSPQRITVNGVEATVEAYNIGGTNFFRLRDLAALLRGTPAQFNVEYDEATNTVRITRGAAYAGEVNMTFADMSATAVPSPQTVYVDGAAVDLTAFNIGGYNFFSLRELAAIFGYAVGYDAATNTAIIESK